MKEFIDKLIERLEKQRGHICNCMPCNGCKYIEDCEEGEFAEDVAIDKAIEIVNQLAEEYNNGWIACSERLPEEELKNAREERGKEAVFPVLATINKVHFSSGEKYKIVSRAFYGCYNDKKFYNACCDEVEVIARKPLDAPFEPRGE